jgi:nicotinamidase-related amidase
MARHELLIARESATAILVDVQEKLLPTLWRPEAALRQAVRLTSALRALDVPLLVTQQNTAVFGPTVAPLREALGEFTPVEKMDFSCLALDAVRKRLTDAGRRQVIVYGIETHICVTQTALDAAAAGFDVHVPFDACTGHGEVNHAAGVDKMRAGGVFPASTETVIYELLAKAGTDEFRKLLPLLRDR